MLKDSTVILSNQLTIEPWNFQTMETTGQEYCFIPGTYQNTPFFAIQKKPDIPLVPEKRKDFSADWIGGYLTLQLLLLLVSTRIYKNEFGWIFRTIYNSQLFYKLFRDPNALFRQQSFLLVTLYYFSAGLFFFFSMHYLGITPETGGFSLTLILAGVVALYFGIKYLMLKFLGFILQAGEQFSEYLFKTRLLNIHVGLILFPLTIFIAFMEYDLKSAGIILGAIVLFINYIIRIYRGIEILSREHIPVYYHILYLCTIEILPVLTLGKFANSLINKEFSF